MGARPLRRAIQRFIEDPFADEVLRAGEIKPGTTVLVDRDEFVDDEDRPLKLKLVKPKRKPARTKAKQPAGVGGRGGGDASDDPGETPKADWSDPRQEGGESAEGR